MSLSTAHLCTMHVSPWLSAAAWLLEFWILAIRFHGAGVPLNGQNRTSYCCCKKSCTTWDVWNQMKPHKNPQESGLYSTTYSLVQDFFQQYGNGYFELYHMSCASYSRCESGRTTSKINSVLLEVSVRFSDKFAATKWMSSTACNSELPRTASNRGNVAPFRMITSHKGATNADDTTPQASLEKTSQKVTQPEIGDESLTSNSRRNISFTALID